MRLDKFLKVSRLIKRRTVAKEAADSARIFLNGKPAKPSAEIKEGSKIALCYSKKTLTVEVLKVPAGNVSVQESKDLYTLVSEEFHNSD